MGRVRDGRRGAALLLDTIGAVVVTWGMAHQNAFVGALTARLEDGDG